MCIRDSAAPFAPAPPSRDLSLAGAEAAQRRLLELAALGDLAYERQREVSARELGLLPTALDRLVKARRRARGAAKEGDGLAGQAIDFAAIEPWPVPVLGDELLFALLKAVRSYVVLTGPQALAVALWAIHTHALESLDVSPRLLLKSQHKRCGKSTLMSLLDRLVAKPVSLSGVTPAALLRMIETHCPTVLIDEMDASMKADKEMAEALRGLLNSGFDRRGASMVKNVPTPEGGYEPRAFSTWAPLAAAGIGKMPDTVRDRSIEIGMERKLRSQKVERLRRRDGADLDELARRIARFAQDNLAALAAARPKMPDSLNDRASDAWEPLVAIADLAGGRWPEEARAAALALAGEAEAAEGETNTMLLSDIRDIFAAENAEILSSEQLAELLARLEDRPWAEWRNGQPMTKNQLSAKLREVYGIVSRSVEVEKRDRKGYRREQFKEAFSRYLPSSSLPDRQIGEPIEDKTEIDDPGIVAVATCDDLETGETPNETKGIDDPTILKEGEGRPTENRPLRHLPFFNGRSGRCAVCGGGKEAGNAFIALFDGDDGADLHTLCWEAWQNSERTRGADE